MDFDFSDDQVALRDAVARWAEKSNGFERRLALAKAGGHSRAVYGELAGLGLTGLAIAEAQGGMGFGPVEAMVVMEELGRALVNAPYAAGALVAPSLLAGAPEAVQQAWLPRMASGDALVVLAHQERQARYTLNNVATRAEHGASGWRLSGQKNVVPAADEADAFIVPARISGAQTDTAGIGLFLVEKGAAQVSGYPTHDGARAGEVVMKASAAALIAEDGFGALERAADIGIAAACAEAVGLMERLLAITVEYMNTRKQFNTTLAGFQALRHRVADMKMQLELGRGMSYYATLKLGEPPAQRRRALSQAKVQLGRSMRQVGQEAIQLHGGIGVTNEYIAGHYFKRLTMLEFAFGDTLHHLGEVNGRMQETAGVFA